MINLTWLFVLIWLLLLFVHACQNVGLCELWRPINVKLEVTTWLWWAQVRTCIVVVILIVIAIIANYVNVLFIRVGTRRWGCKKNQEYSRMIRNNYCNYLASLLWKKKSSCSAQTVNDFELFFCHMYQKGYGIEK